jgi:hypothetical protein
MDTESPKAAWDRGAGYVRGCMAAGLPIERQTLAEITGFTVRDNSRLIESVRCGEFGFARTYITQGGKMRQLSDEGRANQRRGAREYWDRYPAARAAARRGY